MRGSSKNYFLKTLYDKEGREVQEQITKDDKTGGGGNSSYILIGIYHIEKTMHILALSI